LNAVGITAEYNPMHTGHIWQLKEARRLSGAACTVVVMSGDFVQRGTPAIYDKYTRARAALTNGADLVLELPVVYAVSSAEMFALGAVRTMAALNVSCLSFGSESTDLSLMRRVAAFLACEPAAYRECLAGALRAGAPYPAAREEALVQVLCRPSGGALPSSFPSEDAVRKLLRSPNDILGIEYMKAAGREQFSCEFVPVRRIGAQHDEAAEHPGSEMPEGVPGARSASAIRKQLITASRNGKLPDLSVLSCLSPELASAVRLEQSVPLCPEDFRAVLYAKIEDILYRSGYNKVSAAQELTQYDDIPESAAMRILRLFDPSLSVEKFIDTVKTRNITRAHVARCMAHILLGIRKETADRYRRQLPFIRVLGFTQTGQQYLHENARSAPCPVITKTAGFGDLIPEDRHASALYRQIYRNKSGRLLPDEFHAGIIRV
jgi:predicted nucleotidyltransferase